jgi:hypothetical protein
MGFTRVNTYPGAGVFDFECDDEDIVTLVSDKDVVNKVLSCLKADDGEHY